MDILRKYIKVILFGVLILIVFGIILTLVSLFLFNYNIKEGTNVGCRDLNNYSIQNEHVKFLEMYKS